MRFLMVLLVLLGGIAVPAQAAVQYGGMKLFAEGRQCYLGTGAANGATFVVNMDLDGSLGIAVIGNPDWDIGNNETVRVDMTYSNGAASWHEAARGSIDRNGTGFSGYWDEGTQAQLLRNLSSASWVDVAVKGFGKMRVALDGSSPGIAALQRCAGNIVLAKARDLSANEADVMRRIDNAILVDSQGWLLNRYQSGGAWTIAAIDGDTNRAVYRVHYKFNGNMLGWVDVNFTGGQACFRYWDRQGTCKKVTVY